MEDQAVGVAFGIIGIPICLMVLPLLAGSAKSHKSNRRTTGAKARPTNGSTSNRRPTGTKEAKVIRIIDGDTVIVSAYRNQLTIRLDAIDCPEDGQHWGDIAKYGLVKLIGGRRIRLEEFGVDKYGRTLATIYVQPRGSSEWTNVNLRMVTLGHAWVSRHLNSHLPIDRRQELNRLESWARSKRVGLWRETNPVPPWKWRANSGPVDMNVIRIDRWL